MTSKNLSLEDCDCLAGKFIISMPGMLDKRFDRTVIYVCSHSAKGAMGFVVNQFLNYSSESNILSQFGIFDNLKCEKYKNIPIYLGGPVETEKGFILHSSEVTMKSTIHIEKNICLTTDMAILNLILSNNESKKVFFSLGYSGWLPGQLEKEIMANGWLIAKINNDLFLALTTKESMTMLLRF